MTKDEAIRRAAPLLRELVRDHRARVAAALDGDASPESGSVVGKDQGDFSKDAA